MVEHTIHDTLTKHHIHYDSIYIDNMHYIDKSKDTVHIRDQSIEYRYRFLHDTIRITRVDTIPIAVHIPSATDGGHTKIPPWVIILSLFLLIIYLLNALANHQRG